MILRVYSAYVSQFLWLHVHTYVNNLWLMAAVCSQRCSYYQLHGSSNSCKEEPRSYSIRGHWPLTILFVTLVQPVREPPKKVWLYMTGEIFSKSWFSVLKNCLIFKVHGKCSSHGQQSQQLTLALFFVLILNNVPTLSVAPSRQAFLKMNGLLSKMLL